MAPRIRVCRRCGDAKARNASWWCEACRPIVRKLMHAVWTMVELAAHRDLHGRARDWVADHAGDGRPAPIERASIPMRGFLTDSEIRGDRSDRIAAGHRRAWRAKQGRQRKGAQ